MASARREVARDRRHIGLEVGIVGQLEWLDESAAGVDLALSESRAPAVHLLRGHAVQGVGPPVALVVGRSEEALRGCREEIESDLVTRRVGKLQPGLVKRLALLERLVMRFADIRDSESESSNPDSAHEKADEEYEWLRLIGGIPYE